MGKNSSTDDEEGASGAPVFSAGEKVLAFFNSRIYDAKVQKVELRRNKWKYFVHYLVPRYFGTHTKGWNKVWDEWVGVDQLLKLNEGNLKKQQAVNKKQDIIIKCGPSSTQMKEKNSESGGKKRKNDYSEDTVALQTPLKYRIPSKIRQQVVDDREFASQLDKDFVGMDGGELNKTNKKRDRRVWTEEEESALLEILEKLVEKGHHLVNGTFKIGTMSQVENSLQNMFPQSALRADPHIMSKLKTLKKHFRIVNEMVNTPGFKWNDEKKWVEVDTNKTWKAYLKHHKSATGWRGKFFPLYDKLHYIFEPDHVGERFQASADKFEELDYLDVNTSYFEIEKATSSRSIEQVSSYSETDQSHSSPSKRRRGDDTGGGSQINQTDENNGRHLWTKKEEDAVLRILGDLAAKGSLCSNGTFRNGTFPQIEGSLHRLCPSSGLKAKDIESKVKEWKRECSIVRDMLSRTGFSWNGVMKCVEVDNGETWKTYVQNQRKAEWRGKVGKQFPIFDRLTRIFDVDSASENAMQTLAELAEEINCSDVAIQEDICPRLGDQFITNQRDHSHSSQRKRREDDTECDTDTDTEDDKPSEKRGRRTWTEKEENTLLGILEDLVAKGLRYGKGTFRPRTWILIEDALSRLCPESGLKAKPHVESKVKQLKHACSTVCDMLNTDGFSWNNEMKCVEVDSETWIRYVKHHKEANKWRGKVFPTFDRLLSIFQVDCPVVKATKTPAEVVEEMDRVEFNTTDSGTMKAAWPEILDTDLSQSPPSKRRKDDMGGSHHVSETNQKRRRRKWTREEEHALLGILEDLVSKGHHFHGRTFRSSALILIENALCNLCPASGLKAYPHIESKLNNLKNGFRAVRDLLNNGFRWNDKTQCVVVECEESWKTFLQHHKEAGKWRYKHFPHYDRLARIFGVGSTSVKASQAQLEALEGINGDDEVESSDLGIGDDANSRSIDQISTNKEADCFHSQQKYITRKEDVGASLNQVAASFAGMMQTSKEQMRVIMEHLQSKENNECPQPKDTNETQEPKDKNGSQQSKGDHESQQSKENRTGQLRSELVKLGLSITDRVKALRLLMADTWNADFFLTLEEEEKLEFVKQLIDESSKVYI